MPIDPYAPFRFRYRDRRTGRWVQSDRPRPIDEIAARFDEWQVNGIADPIGLDGLNDVHSDAGRAIAASGTGGHAANEAWTSAPRRSAA